MEVAVDSIDSAINAELGGAIRIELCSALSEGGLTPSVGFLNHCKMKINIPIYVMIRCRNGDFVYNNDELEIMLNDLKILKDNGADGFVFGVLTEDNKLDVKSCEKLINMAKPKPCTLHRAFDEIINCEEALENAIKLGFTRILTSGQRDIAFDGMNTINSLIKQANHRIVIMPGAGVNVNNVEEILIKTNATEFHGSAKENIVKNGHSRHVTDVANVVKMVAIYKKLYNL